MREVKEMIRTRVLTSLLGCLGLLLIAVATPVSAPAQVIEMTYNTFFPVTHAHTVNANEWIKEIEKRTNGKVKITMFAAGTLSPPDQTYAGVVKGLSDIGMGV